MSEILEEHNGNEDEQQDYGTQTSRAQNGCRA
jgi:hypothetical protein